MSNDLREIADHVKNICLLFGCTVGTAYTVAGMFANGLMVDRPDLFGDGGRKILDIDLTKASDPNAH